MKNNNRFNFKQIKFYLIAFFLLLTISNLQAQNKIKKAIRFELSGTFIKLKQSADWIDIDDKTAIYKMHYKGGSSCMPQPDKLIAEVKNDVIIVKDYQIDLCTRDIVYRVIDLIVDKSVLSNYKKMKVVYLRNANELEYDFTLQKIVKKK